MQVAHLERTGHLLDNEKQPGLLVRDVVCSSFSIFLVALLKELQCRLEDYIYINDLCLFSE